MEPIVEKDKRDELEYRRAMVKQRESNRNGLGDMRKEKKLVEPKPVPKVNQKIEANELINHQNDYMEFDRKIELMKKDKELNDRGGQKFKAVWNKRKSELSDQERGMLDIH